MGNRIDTSKMTRRQREAYEAQRKLKRAILILSLIHI